MNTCMRCGHKWESKQESPRYCAGCRRQHWQYKAGEKPRKTIDIVDANTRFWSKVKIADVDLCWEWQASLTDKGYGVFRVRAVKHYSHRYSWFLKNGEMPEDMEVCHKCDNPACVNPSHLFLGTHKDNMMDMRDKNRHHPHPGEKNFSAKLTWSQVYEIRSLKGELKQKEIAHKFEIKQSQVSSILQGKSWKLENQIC